MTKNKLTGLLGIAAKAGRVASGELPATEAIRSGKARLVLIAADASDNTKKRFVSLCRSREIESVSYGEKEELGRIIGKAERSVLAVTDEGLANGTRKLLTDAEA